MCERIAPPHWQLSVIRNGMLASILRPGKPRKSHAQVRQCHWWSARKSALDSLRQDTPFQDLMRDKHVRPAVDAILANPENLARVSNRDVMYCLGKMKQLRDVNKAHGGGGVNLDEALAAWTDEDAARARRARPGVVLGFLWCICLMHVSAAREAMLALLRLRKTEKYHGHASNKLHMHAGMHEVLDETFAKAIATLCGPDAAAGGNPADDGLLDVADNGGASTAEARRLLVDGGEGGGAPGASGRRWWQIWKGDSMGAEVVRRLGMQCVVLAVLAAVLWYRDMLPVQVRKRLEAAAPKADPLGTGGPDQGPIDEGLGD